MKKLFLVFLSVCLATMLQAAVSKTVNLTTAGTLSTVLTADELTTITDLTLSGNIDARDFKTMRDAMTVLANIDMSAANVVAYTGTEGTQYSYGTTYAANAIPAEAFSINYQGKKSLTSIKLPNTITSIDGPYAFYGCTGLTTFTIPNSVTTIGQGTFYNCTSLTSLTIPNSVTTIGQAVFDNCTGLISLTIPASVTTIGSYAFAGCSGLTSIRAFNATPVTSPSFSVFDNVPKTIPLYVPVGSKAAYAAADYWKDFTNIIEFDPSVATIANTAGGLATALSAQLNLIKKLTITGTIDARDFKTMRDLMPLLEDVDLSGAKVLAYTGTGGCYDSVATATYLADQLPAYSFAYYSLLHSSTSGKTSLQSIKLPNTIKSIENTALGKCTNLTSVTIPNSVTLIGFFAFQECAKLTSIIIPNSVTTISWAAFMGCGLTSVTIPSSVTSPLKGTFMWCNQLISISIPASVTSIDNTVFNGCNSLSTIYVDPANPSYSVNAGVLYNKAITEMVLCPSAIKGSLIIPNTIATIKDGAFLNRDGLTSITIPNSVTSIGDNAFYNCTGLTSIRVLNPTPISLPSSNVFYNISKTIPLYVPLGSKAAYAAAAYWNEFTNIIEDDPSVVTIANTAGGLATSLSGQLSTITKLTVTGTIDARDFKTMYSMAALKTLDLTNATIVEYSGTAGTYVAPVSTQPTVTYPANTLPERSSYSGAGKVSIIKLPNSLVSIGGYALFGFPLQSITIPSSVTSIIDNAFNNCSVLGSIRVLNPTPVTITAYVFSGVPKTIPLYVPVGSKAAYAAATFWKDFTNIIEIDNATKEFDLNDVRINNTAGGLATALLGQASVINKLTVTGTIDARDFKTMYSMAALKTLDLTDATIVEYSGTAGTYVAPVSTQPTVTYPANTLPERSSYSAISKASIIKLPNSLVSIGGSALDGFTLQSIIIPNSVSSIGNYAFSSCSNLGSIRVFNQTPLPLATYVFYGVPKTIPLYVPVGSKAAYSAAAVWKDFTNIIEIDNATIVSIPGGLATLAGDLTATSIKVVGQIDARDFKTMRDLMPNLVSVDLSGATVVAYTGTEGTGGSTSQTYSANEVPISAFESNKVLTTVSLPSAVTTIGSSAFRFCFALSTLTLPTTLTTINERAFESCALTSFTISSLVSTIGNYAFMGSAITSFTVNTANANYVAVDGVVCNKAVTTIVAFPSGRVGAYTIPSTITTIKFYGIAYSKKITAITIPSSVVSFAGGTFSGCSGITSIRVYSTTPITAVSSDFGSVTKTIPLYVPAGTKALYAAAAGWKDFTNIIEVPETIVCTAGKLSTLLSSVLDQIYTLKITGTIDARDFKTMRDLMPNLATVDLSGATIVAYTGTEGTVSTASRSYPANAISAYAFFDGTNGKSTLTSIVMPTSTTIIGSAAFKNCTKLNTAAIPSGVTSIESSAFFSTKITSALIPVSVTAIGNYVFPSSVTTVNVSWPTPLDVSSNISLFDNYGTLNVPAGTKKLYQAAAVWKNFTIVSPFETSVSSVSMTSAGGTATLGVTSTLTWTAASSAAWLTVSPTVATTGNATVTLTAGATTAARTATITFTAAGMSPQTLTVTQEAGANTLSVATTAVSLDKGASSATVGVTSNTTWTASAGTATWLTLTTTTNLLTIAATANPNATARTATVTLSATGVSSKTITVTQAGNPSIALGSTTAALGKANGNTTTFTITCNTSWAINTPDAWVSASALSGTGDATITLTAVGDNPLATTRNSVLLITSTGFAGAKGLTVTQAANPTVSAVATASVAKTANSTATVAVSSNTTWTATSSATWLTATGATTGNGTLTLTATETNPTIATRTATITLAATGATSQTITVTQAAGDATLSVAATIAAVTKAAKSTATVAVTSNTAWTATTAATWLTATGATTGNGTITITTTEANPTITARTATISVAATGATSQTITVTQAAGDPTLSVAATTAAVTKAAKSTATVAVSSNTTWTATTAATWFTIAPTTATTGNGTLTITTTEANPTITARTASITVAATGIATAQTITVTQAAGDPTVLVATTASLTKAANVSATLVVTSNTTWTAKTSATWLSVSPTIATTGKGTLVISSLSANPLVTDRTATVTLSATGVVDQIVTVTQAKGDPTLSVVSATASVAKTATSSTTVAVTANAAWTATTAATWLTVSNSTTNAALVTITANATNPSVGVRTATVTLSSTANGVTVTKDIAVTQAAGDPTLVLGAATLDVVKTAGVANTVAVTANTAWTASSNVTWLTVSNSTANAALVTITANETNPTIATRAATVTLTATANSVTVTKTITVTQAAGDPKLALSAATASLSKAAASTSSVDVTSNTTWTASTNDIWFTITPAVATQGNATITIKAISANTTVSDRTGTITVSATGVTPQTITVTQSAGDATVVVATTASLTKVANSSTDLAVTSNTTWTAKTSAAWLSVSQSVTTGDGILTIKSTDANPTITSRTATVLVSAAGASTITIVVSQAAGDATLMVVEKTVSLEKAANSSASIQVTSNANWNAVTAFTWLKVSITKTATGGMVTVLATEANPTVAERSGTVSVTAAGIASPIFVTVTQAAGDATLSVVSSLELGAVANNSAVVEVTSNTDWNVVSDAKWLSVSPASAKGNTAFSVLAAENKTIESRVATITVSAVGVADRTITVTQAAGAASLEAAQTSLFFDAVPKQDLTIGVLSNTKWTATSSADWLTVTPAKGADNSDITFSAIENKTIETRSAVVTLSAAGAKDVTIEVSQAAGFATIAAESKESTFLAVGGKIEVAVTSNSPWKVSNDATWLSIESVVNLGNASFIVVATKNNSVTPRSADVVVEATGANPVFVHFTQVGDTIVTISESTVQLAANTNLTKAVSVESNTNWNAVSSSDWLSVTPSANTDQTTLVNVTANENTSIVARTGSITISAKGVKDQIITVKQVGDTVLSVSKASESFAAAKMDSVKTVVTSNTKWAVASSASWLSTRATADSGNADLTIIVQENKTILPRTASLTLSAKGAAERTITVSQVAGAAFVNVPAAVRVSAKIDTASSITVDANTAWTAIAVQEWLTVTPATATGAAEMIISAVPNSDIAPRTGLVILSAGKIRKTISVTQGGDTVLSVSTNAHTFAAKADTLKLAVTANIAWEATASAEWVNVNPAKQTGDGQVVVSALANTSIKPRTATVKVANGAIVREIAITQVGDTTMTVSNAAILFAATADSVSLPVTANTKWTTSSSQSWLSTVAVVDSGSADLRIVAKRNVEKVERTGDITVSAKGVEPIVIHVIQAASPSFVDVPASVRVAATKDTVVAVAVQSNVTWTAMAVDEWLSLDMSNATGDATLSITAESNKSLTPRKGSVLLSAGSIRKTISVEQGGDTVLTVNTTAHTFAAKADTLKLAVTANSWWEATTSADWLIASPAKQTGNAELVISALANTSIKPRTASIRLENNAIVRQIAITQVGDTILSCNTTAISLRAKQDTASLALTANTAWKAVSSESWLNIVSSVDSGSTSLQIIASHNKVQAERTAKITISAKGASPKEIVVTQAASPAFVSVPALVTLAASVDTIASVEVSANVAWTAIAVDDWLTIDPTSATGDATMTIKAESNKGFASRKGSILLSSGKIKQTIVVNQYGTAELSVSNTSISAEKTGIEAQVTVKANVAWTVASSDEWVSVVATGQSGNGSLAISVAANTTSIARTATVTVSSSDAAPQTIRIEQAAGDAAIEVSTATVTFNEASANPVSVSVSANKDWTATSDAEWLTLSLSNVDLTSASSTVSFATTSATSTALWFVASKNTTTNDRVATVTITIAGAEPQVITVIQAAAPVVVVSELSLSETSLAITNTAKVDVTANKDWTATSDADWLQVSLSGVDFASVSSSVSFATASSTTAALWFVAASNTTTVERTANVTVTVAGIDPQVITVKQAAAPVVVTPELSVSMSSVNFTNATSTVISVEVTSNVAWTASSNEEWLHVSLSGGDFNAETFMMTYGTTSTKVSFNAASSTTSLWFIAATNTTSTDRSAIVTIVGEGCTPQTVLVNQPATPVVVTPELSVSTSAVTFTAATSTATVEVTANKDWTATSDADWLQVSLSGVDLASASSTVSFATATTTSTALWFVAASNTTTVERTAKVTINVAGAEPKVITITQPAAAVISLTVSRNAVDFPAGANATKEEVKIQSTNKWQIESTATWLHVEVNEAQSAIYMWTTEANPTVAVRTALVNVSAVGAASQVISVTQAAGVAKVSVSVSDVKPSAAAGTTVVTVTANTTWTTRTTANWLTLSSTASELSIATSENKTILPRNASVEILVNGVVVQTINVSQSAGEASVSAASTASVESAANSSVRIAVSANTKWSAVSSESWVTITQSTTSGDGEIIVSVSANPSNVARKAVILLTGTGATAQTITITQAAGTTDAPETSASSIAVYPNPTTEYFMLNTNATVKVYNQAGTFMFAKQVVAGESIAVDALSVGTYKVVIETPSSQTTQQLIKQ